MIAKAKSWLAKSACPLWLNRGIDWQRGGFYENLNFRGEPTTNPRRVMVQARQIFSARVAMNLGVVSSDNALKVIEHGINFILKNYSQSSGAFYHAVDENLEPLVSPDDLYGQSFALLGLANAYLALKNDLYKDRALELLAYLKRERRLPQGGYSEVLKNQIQYEANPHMHLFESLLFWAEIDTDPSWMQMADEVLELCLGKFIDAEKHILAEHFDASWKPLVHEGKFIWEPGHHYEWVWLLGRYQKLAGKDLTSIRQKLYDVSEMYGINPENGCAYDEMGSDLRPHKNTSRFWPQCERVKAALQLGFESKDKAMYAKTADQSLEALFTFLDIPSKGLWCDAWQYSGASTL